MSALEDAARPVFARHETFHPRYGWFLKGVEAARASPEAFTLDRAPVNLGVGKNMVKAIRFWCRAAKLLTEVDNPTQPRRPFTVPTDNAVAVFDEVHGLDPYLELPGSLWLLHWWMLATPCTLPVWWIALNDFGAVEFSTDDLEEFVSSAASRANWPQPSSSAVAKDVDCLVRMYAPRPSRRGLFDDAIDSPFRELGLVEADSSEYGRLRFNLGAKPSLPDALVAFACFDFLSRSDTSARVISIHRLGREPGSPGRIFKLTDGALADALERYGSSIKRRLVTNAAGSAQLAIDEAPTLAASNALYSYYAEAGYAGQVLPRLGPDAVDGHAGGDPVFDVVDHELAVVAVSR